MKVRIADEATLAESDYPVVSTFTYEGNTVIVYVTDAETRQFDTIGTGSVFFQGLSTEDTDLGRKVG